MHAGNAARNGVISALLAREGITSDDDILAGRFSFSDTFSDGKVRDAADPYRDLGHVWDVASVGIAFKPYPCCRSTHAAVDATLYMRDKYKIRAEEVAAVSYEISPVQIELARFHRPRTGYEGKFSLEYCIAASLLNGAIYLQRFYG